MTALVFNFIDQLTHGRTENSTLFEVARDTSALRNLTRTWFERSPLWDALREAERRGVPVLLTTDHGSIHCHTPATVFAKRDTTSNLRYKFGDDLRAQDADAALVVDDLPSFGLPARTPGTRLLLATGDRFFVYPDQAAGVPGALPGGVPARRRLARGGHPADRPADAAARADGADRAPAPAPGRALPRAARRSAWSRRFLASLLDGFTLVILIPAAQAPVRHRRRSSAPGSTQLEAFVTRLTEPLVAGLTPGPGGRPAGRGARARACCSRTCSATPRARSRCGCRKAWCATSAPASSTTC